MSNPLVSIWCSAYNHQKYISQAIEGFLMQKTDFPVEIFIHDDASPDETANLIRRYAAQNPQIRPILLQENMFSADRSYLNRIMFKEARGKYIAMCEGDDYWTDPLKLQKQIDFLEANPDFAICFHRVKVQHEDDETKSHLSNPDQKEVTTFEDLADGNYIHTPSCVFRNNLFAELPDWFMDSPVGDYPLHLLNAEHGKIKFFENVMAVYRVHKGGVWSLQGMKKRSAEYMKTVEFCKKHFAPRGAKQFSEAIDGSLTNLCFLAFENEEYQSYRDYYRRCIKGIRRRHFRMSLNLTLRYLLSYSPATALIYRKFRSDTAAR